MDFSLKAKAVFWFCLLLILCLCTFSWYVVHDYRNEVKHFYWKMEDVEKQLNWRKL